MASKKKTIAQQAIGLASPVLPAPVAKIAGTRWGSRLLILLLPFLFATGVLTISWNNGIPTVNFDRARALLVGQQVGERVQQEAVRVAQDVRERQAMSGPQSMGPQSMGPQSMGPQSMGPQSVGPQSVGPQSMGPQSMGPQSVGQQSAWGQAQPTSWQGQPAYQQPAQPQRQSGFQQPAYPQQPAAPQWGPPAYR
jgi:hypothetical protein